MGTSRAELAEIAGIPIENVHPVEPGLHMEIINTKTMQVWQAMANVTQAEYDALVVQDPYRKIGAGALAAYCSYFRRSPDAESDGPMQTLEHAGYRWSHCANPVGPPTFPAGPDGPRLMTVHKHHSIVYAAGKDLRLLESPTGDTYVHVVGGGRAVEDLVVPEGWSFRVVRLEKETTVELPCPTSVFFFQSSKVMESYQGPVSTFQAST